ncbi:MAG: hypothetical protein JRF18_05485 [Deltaproteobacteria bacterium]|nr:hypothetical protein [Deltaproteobacteria bacterium]
MLQTVIGLPSQRIGVLVWLVIISSSLPQNFKDLSKPIYDDRVTLSILDVTRVGISRALFD